MSAKNIEFFNSFTSLLENKEFLELKTNEERIAFILKSIRPLTLYRRYMVEKVRHYSERHRKSEARTILFRNEGINYFNNENYREAIHMFTKAIVCAPFPSNENSVSSLSLAFGHLSLAQFKVKDFSGSLVSANFSLKLCQTLEILLNKVYCLCFMAKYEESLQYLNELIERYNSIDRMDFKSTSIEELNTIKEHLMSEISKTNNCLKYDSPKTIHSEELRRSSYDVWLHPNCKISENERKGRHMVSTNFIPKNTIILIEKPMSVALLKERTKVCNYCYKMDIPSIWPCLQCDEEIYCDENCSKKAYDEYHHKVCGIIGMLNEIGSSYVHTFQYISKMETQKSIQCQIMNKSFDFNEFLEKIKEIDKNSQNMEMTLDFETKFKAIYSLINNYSIEDKVSHTFHIFRAIELSLILDSKSLIDFDIEEEFEKFITLVDICFKTSNKISMNVFSWYRILSGRQKQYFGSYMCCVSSLFNHSCQPNVFWSFIDTNIVMKTVEDIIPGQDLCITYGPKAIFDTFIERQKKLKISYWFDCNCKACLRDVKSIMCLRCQQCSGPVVNLNLQTFIVRDINCMECGQKYEQAKQCFIKLEAIKKKLDQTFIHLENDYNIDVSLKVVTNLLKSLSLLVFPKNGILRNYMKQLIKEYNRCKHYFEGLQCIETLVNSIDLNYEEIKSVDSISPDIIDELIVWTNCFYGLVLNDCTLLNENQWSLCFSYYSKLFEFLNIVKSLKINEKKILDKLNLISITTNKRNEFNIIKEYHLKTLKNK